MTAKTPKTTAGRVLFVAVGPGDPELLTVRAVDIVRSATVVVADAASSEVVASHLPAEVELVRPVDESGKALTVAARVKVMVDIAKGGRDVVRLLAGDPTLDGTLAAEASAVAKAGIGFEVAVGVSVATAAPVYAGFALTGTDAHAATTLDAAHLKGEWAVAADKSTSLVFLNAHSKVAGLAKSLLDAGWSSEAAVAVLRNPTTVEQESMVGTLSQVAAGGPAMSAGDEGVFVVSATIAQRELLNWFEQRPLLGWKVLVPRTRDAVGPIEETVRRIGGVVVEVPTISVEPPRTPQQMERAITGMVSGRFEWVAFTSPNAVRAVQEKLQEYGLDVRSLAGMKVAAIGEDSVEALHAMGIWGIPVITIENACASGTTALHEAILSVEDGRYGNVLAVGVEKMTDNFNGAIHPESTDIEGRSGLALPSLYAMAATRYQQVHGLTDADLALVAVKNHGHAVHNDRAAHRTPHTAHAPRLQCTARPPHARAHTPPAGIRGAGTPAPRCVTPQSHPATPGPRSPATTRR